MRAVLDAILCLAAVVTATLFRSLAAPSLALTAALTLDPSPPPL